MGIKDHYLYRAFNGHLAFTCSILMLSQVNYGMDQAAFTTTQAMDAFAKQFGVLNPKTQKYIMEPYFLSLLNSLVYIGQVFGVLTGGWISHRWGRRTSFRVMCCWAFLAAILLVTAKTKEQMMVGRIFNYVYVGQELSTIPVMQAEIVPPNVRGFVVGTYQLGLMLGGFIMALIAYGTSQMEGPESYKIPLGLFFIVPAIVFCSVWFMVESPRWLLLRDRREEALEALRKYRQGRFSEEEILREFEMQLASVQETHEKGNFKEMWQGTNLKRSLIVIGANICGQISGQSFASKYGTLFLKQIGALNPFMMTAINTACYMVVVLFCMYLSDKAGRRPILLVGSMLQTGSYFAMAGLGMHTPQSRPYLVGISAMLTTAYAGFCFGWALISHILTSEIPNTRLRDVTYTVASTCYVITQFAVTFTVPYLVNDPYAALGPKVGFIYGTAALGTIIFTIFCIPECRRLSLEEIDHLFEEKVPVRKFGKYRHGEILPTEVLDVAIAEKLDNEPSVQQKEVS